MIIGIYTCCKSYLCYLYYGLYREDLEKQTNLTSKYHGRMKELQVLLESSRSRVQVNIKSLLLLFDFQNKIFKSLMRESVWIFIYSTVRLQVTLTYQTLNHFWKVCCKPITNDLLGSRLNNMIIYWHAHVYLNNEFQ